MTWAGKMNNLHWRVGEAFKIDEYIDDGIGMKFIGLG